MAVYLGTYEISSTGSYDPITEAPDAIRFIDYDGEIIESYSAESFMRLEAMPENPAHTGLVAQGWNWTLQDAKTFVSKYKYLDIGQVYITASGDTEIDIRLIARLEPYLRIAVNGTVQINWGDGSAVSTVTGTSLTTAIDTKHIYSTRGNYTITIHVVSGAFSFYETQNVFLLHGENTSSHYNRVYSNAILAIRLGNNCHIGNYAFYFCSSMKSITIPNNVPFTTIGTYAFAYCYSLKHITYPNGITTIGQLQSDCSLISISLPKTITAIVGSCISNSLSALKTFIIPSDSFVPDSAYRGGQNSTLMTLMRLIVPHQNIIEVKTPNTLKFSGMTTIPNECFGSILTLLSVNIPETITSIGSYAFYNCQNLQEVILPNTISTLNSYTFSYCYSLNKINIPSNVTTLGSGLFHSCYSLQEIDLPESITTIQNSVFNSCYSLQQINIPANVTSIGNSAFGYCYSLSEINIPVNVTSIGSSTFTYCYSLSEITIPTNVTSIGSSAFAYCYGLKEIHMLPTTPPTIQSDTFRSLTSDCTIYVPSASLSAYQSATNWSALASQMVGE